MGHHEYIYWYIGTDRSWVLAAGPDFAGYQSIIRILPDINLLSGFCRISIYYPDFAGYQSIIRILPDINLLSGFCRISIYYPDFAGYQSIIRILPDINLLSGFCRISIYYPDFAGYQSIIRILRDREPGVWKEEYKAAVTCRKILINPYLWALVNINYNINYYKWNYIIRQCLQSN